jgi:hypothetical protein
METSYFPQAVTGVLPFTEQPAITAAAHTTNEVDFIFISPWRKRRSIL